MRNRVVVNAKVQFVEFDVSEPLYRQAEQMRNELLRLPLGLNLFDEDRSGEKDDRHFGLVERGELIACLVISELGDAHVKLRQMCVAAKRQSGGLGRYLIEQTEMVLGGGGVESIELAARLPARQFYERLGYQVVGEVFIEVTIEHIKMRKRLVSPISQ